MKLKRTPRFIFQASASTEEDEGTVCVDSLDRLAEAAAFEKVQDLGLGVVSAHVGRFA
jgi:hypothetical protein